MLFFLTSFLTVVSFNFLKKELERVGHRLLCWTCACRYQPLPSGIEEMMPDYHILVCSDGSGTAVRDKFIEEAEMRGLTVNPCSQTGGDKYKGSLIVYTYCRSRWKYHWSLVIPVSFSILQIPIIKFSEIACILQVWRGHSRGCRRLV